MTTQTLATGRLSRRRFLTGAARLAAGLALPIPHGAGGGPPRLRDIAAAQGFELGCEISGGGLADARWRATVARVFNLVVVDWGVYWPSSEPRRGCFETGIVAPQLAFARAAGLRVRAHPLVFPSTLPAWLRDGGFDAAELASILETHVRTLATVYRGAVGEWVVVNEPYTPPHITDDLFHAALGDDYIELAFRAARAADPTATLIFNHNRNHTPADLCTPRTLELVERLARLGLVDRVGVQLHLDAAAPPDKADVAAALRAYPVPACVTEFDVDLSAVAGPQAERLALQAEITGAMVAAARASGNCRSFTVWTIGDRYSCLERDYNRPHSDPTLFDDDLRPKPAFAALRAAVMGDGQAA